MNANYFTAGWRSTKAIAVVCLTLIACTGLYTVWMHSQHINRHCTKMHAQQTARNLHILATFCSTKGLEQDSVCVQARVENDEDPRHAIQTCEFNDIRHHLGLDDPWFVVAVMNEVNSISWRFIAVMAIVAYILVRTNYGFIQTAKDATSSVLAARSAFLPTVHVDSRSSKQL